MSQFFKKPQDFWEYIKADLSDPLPKEQGDKKFRAISNNEVNEICSKFDISHERKKAIVDLINSYDSTLV